MKEVIAHIGRALKEARLKKGLSQKELGLKVKIPQAHISKIENAEVDLQISTLIQIARVLNYEVVLLPVSLLPMVKGLQKPIVEEQLQKYRIEDLSDESGI